MKHQSFRKTWLEAFEGLKSRVVSEFGEEGFRLLKENIVKLGTDHYNKRKYILLGEERKIYDFLIVNSYNPYTVYRWFLFEKIPEDVRFQLKQGNLTQKMASKIQFKRRHESKSKVCVDIQVIGLNLVRSM